MEQQPNQERRRKLSDELIASAKRGEVIEIEKLNPLETSAETVATIRLIQRKGHLALDMAQLTL
ncbi:MAG: hypothetical protein WAW80_01010 [Candidatus Saccharimonadales bacterium]